MMKIPGEYKADRLFLLIEEDPLFNFIAIQLLLKKDGQLYLVRTSGTKFVTDSLSKYCIEALRMQPPVVVVVPEADSHAIYSTIKAEIASIDKEERVGLHYTGGTKLMSVHAYRAVMATCKKHSAPPIFSYLDTRLNAMRIDVPGKPTFTSESILHEFKPQPMLEDIVELYSSRMVRKIEREARLFELAKELMQVHCSDEGATAWRVWCDRTLSPLKKKRDWARESVLKKVTLDLPAHSSLQDVVEQFKKKVDLRETHFPLVTTSKKLGFKKGKHLCEWLNEKWLNHYALSLLLELRGEKEINDCGMNIRSNTKQEVDDYSHGYKPVKSPRSEIRYDLAAIKGNHMFTFTCTIDTNHDLCKLKLLEDYQRAHNISERFIFPALICLVKNARQLEREISRALGIKVKVFGRNDLGQRDKFIRWFTSVE